MPAYLPVHPQPETTLPPALESGPLLPTPAPHRLAMCSAPFSASLCLSLAVILSSWLSSSPPSSRLPLEPRSGPWALLLRFLGLDLLSRSPPFIWPLQASLWGHILPGSLPGDFPSHQEGAVSAGVHSLP